MRVGQLHEKFVSFNHALFYVKLKSRFTFMSFTCKLCTEYIY